MKKKFKIGDQVKIVSLDYRDDVLTGKIGHEGKITSIENDPYGEPFYTLNPHVTGSNFPAVCLELIGKAPEPSTSNNLFSIEDL